MEKVNLENEFLQYLKLSLLKQEDLSTVQLTEMKRAFYAGCGQMFRLMESFAELPDEEGMASLAEIDNQVNNFWLQSCRDESFKDLLKNSKN